MPVTLGLSRFYVIGGKDAAGHTVNFVASYHTIDRTWQREAPMYDR